MDHVIEEQCFTAEKLLEVSLKNTLTIFWNGYLEKYGHNPPEHRHPDTTHGFLTKERVAEMFTELDHDQLLIAAGLVIISNGEVFFLSDDHCFAHSVLPKEFIPCSVSGLHNAIGEGKRYSSVNDILSHYCKGEIHLNSMQELVDYLNKEYGE